MLLFQRTTVAVDNRMTGSIVINTIHSIFQKMAADKAGRQMRWK